MSIRAQLTLFGGWSKDPCLRIFIRRVLGIQPCSMARFGRMFALGSGDGKTVPTKTCPSSLHRLSRTLSAEKKRVPLRFFTFPVKSTRALFKEIALSGKRKNTVICGIKSMSNTANVENAGSINNPPGCFGFDHSRTVAAVVVNLVVLAAYLTASTILFPVVFVIFCSRWWLLLGFRVLVLVLLVVFLFGLFVLVIFLLFLSFALFFFFFFSLFFLLSLLFMPSLFFCFFLLCLFVWFSLLYNCILLSIIIIIVSILVLLVVAAISQIAIHPFHASSCCSA